MLLETIQGKSVSCLPCLAGEIGKLDNRVLRSQEALRGAGGAGSGRGCSRGPSPGFNRTVPSPMSSSSWLVTEIVADSWKSFTQIFCFFPPLVVVLSHIKKELTH